MPNPLHETKLTSPTKVPEAKGSALAPVNIDDAKITFLLANPHLVSSYGSDAASKFVATLRDSALDPGVRRTRIIEQRDDLNHLAADLDEVITRTTSVKMKADATFMRENLQALLSLSETIADVDVVDMTTSAIEGVVDVVTDPKRQIYRVPRDGGILYEDGVPVESKSRQFVIVEQDDAKMDEHHRMTNLIAIGLLPVTLMAYFFLPTIVFAAVFGALLVLSILFITLTSKIVKPVEAVDQNKFLTFVDLATDYNYGRVEALMGLSSDLEAHDRVEDEAIRRWFLDAQKVFSAISTESFVTYVKPRHRDENFVETQEHRAIEKLAKGFDEALVHTDAYIADKRIEAESARLAVLKKIEDDKRLADYASKKKQVLDEFLATETSSAAKTESDPA